MPHGRYDTWLRNFEAVQKSRSGKWRLLFYFACIALSDLWFSAEASIFQSSLESRRRLLPNRVSFEDCVNDFLA
jgi:hypothetical protein